MEEEITLDCVFSKLKNTNSKINSKFEDILKLKLKMNTEYIQKLSEISTNLNFMLDELDDIYYHLLDNDDSYIKSNEEKNKIKNNKIDLEIKNKFLPFMLVMKMALENQ